MQTLRDFLLVLFCWFIFANPRNFLGDGWAYIVDVMPVHCGAVHTRIFVFVCTSQSRENLVRTCETPHRRSDLTEDPGDFRWQSYPLCDHVQTFCLLNCVFHVNAKALDLKWEQHTGVEPLPKRTAAAIQSRDCITTY